MTTEAKQLLYTILVVAVCVIVRLVLHLITHYQVDDAFITYRYAENLASGLGFVYNPGERVLGTSSPLFTLVLALGGLIGISVKVLSLVISLVSAGVTAFVLVGFGRSLKVDSFNLLPVLLYAVYPRNVISDISGLETAYFTLLVVSAIYCSYVSKHGFALALSSLAAIARPEGFGILAVSAVAFLLDRAPRRWVYLIFPVVLVGGWITFSYSYFGSVIPNSVIAKAALYSAAPMSIQTKLGLLTTLGNFVGTIVFVALILATAWVLWRRDRLAVVAITVLGYISVLSIFSPRIFFWYAAPALPLAFLIAVKFIASLHDTISSRLASLKSAALRYAAQGIVIVVCLYLTISRGDGLKQEMTWYSIHHIAAAIFLNTNAQPGDKVMAEDIGYLGYIYQGSVIDVDGLVTPSAIDYNLRSTRAQFADSVKPDWIFVAVDNTANTKLLSSEWLRTRYVERDYYPNSSPPTHKLFHTAK